jgi:AraC-like DNA-binding protein
MRYLICKNQDQLIHVSSGQLLSEDHFIHPRRNLDTCVIIICIKGTLYISQDNRRYTLTENQYIILFAGHEHYGFKESGQELSYYWCHFRIKNKYNIVSHDELIRIFNFKYSALNSYNMEQKASYAGGIYPYSSKRINGGGGGRIKNKNKHYSDYYILPEFGDISPNGRAVLIFRQLLDMSRKDCYSQMIPNYALSLLIAEISQEFIESYLRKNRETNPKMEKIIEWIRVNFNARYSINEIAKRFIYNGDYLSTAFRRYTGIPLMKYINIVRITNAKKQLLNTTDCIKEIAWRTGFEDEKTFMKKFKQIEGITPSTYRNAFTRSKIVCK